MDTKIFQLNKLNPAPYNPRKDLKPGDTEYEAIQNSIQQFGFVEPLVVNIHDDKNVIVGGHQRYKILLAKHVTQTEAVVVDLDEQDEKALNLALNKIDGDWDNDKLRDLLKELGQDAVIDIGFTKEDYDDLMRSYNESTDACNCCGVPPEWKASQQGNIGQAIIIARTKGKVYFSDIAPSIYKYFNGFRWASAQEYNTGSNKSRALKYDMTMAEFLRNNWNNVSSATSPARAYGGILKPCGVDEKGDVVYQYNGK